ncbi:extracellular solute-binding protein [Actinocorallia aurantiaca]|uniref:ABC transporter substrate-binding protein n=1 Tax=Actinocorallia aurantiaca TaxID=46204 RepID=A0ABN3U225_9ACTN
MNKQKAVVAGAFVTGMVLVLAVLVTLKIWPDEHECPKRAGELVVLGGKDVSVGRELQSLIEGWPGVGGTGGDAVKARLRELPGTADLQHSQASATAQGGGCGVDVYLLDTPWIPQFAKAGWLHPLAEGTFEELKEHELIKPLVAGNLRRSGYYDGRLWAVPLHVDVPLLYYRKDLLEKYGGAQGRLSLGSWEEVWKGAERVLAGETGETLKAGYAAQLADYEGFTVNVLELTWAHGDADGDGAVPGGAALQALRSRLQALTGERPLIDPRSFSWHEDDATEAFRNGETVFLRNWPTAYPRLVQGLSGGAKEFGEKYGVVALPPSGEDGVRGVLGGQSLAVAANSPYRKEALELIRYLTGAQAQRSLFRCGGFAPGRAQIYYESGEDCAAHGSGAKSENVVRGLPAQYMPTLLEAIKGARPRPSSPYYTHYSRVFRALLRCGLQTPPSPDCGEGDEDWEETLAKALEGR